MSEHTTRPPYERYHIKTGEAPDIVRWPNRFNVKVGKVGLATHLVKEVIHQKGDLELILARPCIYGVFSRPVGGFAPDQKKCVGCLRCMNEYPEFVEVSRNPERERLGDSYFVSAYVDAVAYEAGSGRVPVKGAGYRGKFGGAGWDGIWTDMSEIVRPTRDGIHGREFISTVVDIGTKPCFLSFDTDGQPVGSLPDTFSIPLPMIFDAPAAQVATDTLYHTLAQAAEAVQNIAILPLDAILRLGLSGEHLAPLVGPGDGGRIDALGFTPRLIEVDSWDADLFAALRDRFPQAQIVLRLGFTSGDDLLAYADRGVSVFHLTADYHGRGEDGAFIFDLIRDAHNTFVEAGRRDEVTLLGSGGVIAAEHVPKAIAAGLDAVALDTPLLVALQARFSGDFISRHTNGISLPNRLTAEWGAARLGNLMAAWRDQLLEVLGAMGLREVRRLRGEMGRVLLQKDLEYEAFAGIEGYLSEGV
jgi:hypothetical protein